MSNYQDRLEALANHKAVHVGEDWNEPPKKAVNQNETVGADWDQVPKSEQTEVVREDFLEEPVTKKLERLTDEIQDAMEKARFSFHIQKFAQTRYLNDPEARIKELEAAPEDQQAIASSKIDSLLTNLELFRNDILEQPNLVAERLSGEFESAGAHDRQNQVATVEQTGVAKEQKMGEGGDMSFSTEKTITDVPSVDVKSSVMMHEGESISEKPVDDAAFSPGIAGVLARAEERQRPEPLMDGSPVPDGAINKEGKLLGIEKRVDPAIPTETERAEAGQEPTSAELRDRIETVLKGCFPGGFLNGGVGSESRSWQSLKNNLAGNFMNDQKLGGKEAGPLREWMRKQGNFIRKESTRFDTMTVEDYVKAAVKYKILSETGQFSYTRAAKGYDREARSIRDRVREDLEYGKDLPHKPKRWWYRFVGRRR